MGNTLSQHTARDRLGTRADTRGQAVAPRLWFKLPAELTLKCIDAIDGQATLLAMSQVNRATRAFVVETPAYQAFVNGHQAAMLTQALRGSRPLSPYAGLPSAHEVRLHRLPMQLRSAAHVRKVLGNAAALNTLTLDLHWLEAPYACVLMDSVQQSSTLTTLRVVRALDGAHGPRNAWDHEDISASQLRALTGLAGALARKTQATLSLEIPIGMQATQSLFGQAKPPHATLTAVAFSLPTQMKLADVAHLAESLAGWTRLEQVRIDPGYNVNRRDLGLPKLATFLDAIPADWQLQLLDVSGFGDVKNSALAAVEKRLGALSHIGTIRCNNATVLQALPMLGAPLAVMGEELQASYAPRIESTRR